MSPEESTPRKTEKLERRFREQTTQLDARIEDLEAFSYFASHDLRAPLRSMRATAEALLEDGSAINPTVREFTTSIVQSAVQMEELIDGILEFGRLSRADFEARPVRLLHVFKETVRQLDGQIRETGGHINIAGDDLLVAGHEPTLVQVLTNLVANALKFCTPPAVPSATLRAQRDGDWVIVWVEDKGIGIKSRDRERIFHLFERLHALEEFPGSGVGLAIVKRGTERMGGKVGVESTPGKGSRFWLQLPAA
ncbi:MAG: HAMP domain-containing sensor histidine kinase [Chloroflexota bacterium]